MVKSLVLCGIQTPQQRASTLYVSKLIIGIYLHWPQMTYYKESLGAWYKVLFLGQKSKKQLLQYCCARLLDRMSRCQSSSLCLAHSDLPLGSSELKTLWDLFFTSQGQYDGQIKKKKKRKHNQTFISLTSNTKNQFTASACSPPAAGPFY